MVDFTNHPGLNQEIWTQSDPYERLDALQKLENELAIEQCRPSCRLETVVAGAAHRGHFEPSYKDIWINSDDVIANNSPRDAIDTVAHEGRHAYQFDVITAPEKHPEIDISLQQQWLVNWYNYRPADVDFTRYRNQPIEADAHAFADGVLDAFDRHQADRVHKVNSDPAEVSQSIIQREIEERRAQIAEQKSRISGSSKYEVLREQSKADADTDSDGFD